MTFPLTKGLRMAVSLNHLYVCIIEILALPDAHLLDRPVSLASLMLGFDQDRCVRVDTMVLFLLRFSLQGFSLLLGC